MLNTLLTALAARLSAFWISILRTAPTVIVAAIAGSLAERNIEIDVSSRQFVIGLITSAAALAWYALWRRLELLGKARGLDWLATFAGLMVGLPAPPTYTQTVEPAAARAPPSS